MTEALATAIFHLPKPNLMREKRICTGLPLYVSGISVQWKWSLCPCFMCGPRSTSVLGLRILQSYVPLRAGWCESLPHMKHRTEGEHLTFIIKSCIHLQLAHMLPHQTRFTKFSLHGDLHDSRYSLPAAFLQCVSDRSQY